MINADNLQGSSLDKGFLIHLINSLINSLINLINIWFVRWLRPVQRTALYFCKSFLFFGFFFSFSTQHKEHTLKTLENSWVKRFCNTGLVQFMGYGDLWGLKFTVLIFYKSKAGIYGDLWVNLGWLENIYGDLWGFMGIYGKHAGDINPHKSQPWIYKKSILSILIPINPHNP